jgi:hypothetical protein
MKPSSGFIYMYAKPKCFYSTFPVSAPTLSRCALRSALRSSDFGIDLCRHSHSSLHQALFFLSIFPSFSEAPGDAVRLV